MKLFEPIRGAFARLRQGGWTRGKILAVVIGIEVLAVGVAVPIIISATRGADRPDSMARALNSFEAEKLERTREHLRDARDNDSEPNEARKNAREALQALRAGAASTARSAIVDGAAAENFDNALEALRDEDLTGGGSARDYLRRAEGLPGYGAIAQQALLLVEAKRLKAAKREVRAALAATA